jgi:putative Holliday junction resolvase
MVKINLEKFKNKKILAIDFGTKITGLARFCEGRDMSPYPYDSLKYVNDDRLISEILNIVKESSTDVAVLGVPKLLDGTETSMSKKIRDFGQKLEDKLGSIPLYFQDESLSTFEAEERMRESPRYNFKVDKKQIDALAASIILEDFLSSAQS